MRRSSVYFIRAVTNSPRVIRPRTRPIKRLLMMWHHRRWKKKIGNKKRFTNTIRKKLILIENQSRPVRRDDRVSTVWNGTWAITLRYLTNTMAVYWSV